MKLSILLTAFLLICSCAIGTASTGGDAELLAKLRAKVEKGDARAQFTLGGAYYGGLLGLATNYTQAAAWYRKAAEQNHAQAQYQE